MRTIFKNLLMVMALATLMVAVTSCTSQNKIAEGVQATLAEATVVEGTVEARVQATQNANQTSVPPTQPVVLTETPANDLNATVIALQGTQTALAATEPPTLPSETPAGSGGPVTITKPVDGSNVKQTAGASGTVDASALNGKNLTIIVTTRTGELWVQIAPTIQKDGTWSTFPVVFGTITLGNNEQYLVCAVITDEKFGEGQIHSYPAGPKACVTVTRKD